MSVTFPLEHNGTTYHAEIMTIKSTTLGSEDHGIFTGYLHCEAPGTGIGVGGYGMDSPSPDRSLSRIGTAYGMEWIMRVLRTVGVGTWEKLPGSRVLVLFTDSNHLGTIAAGIANIDSGKALIFKEMAKEFFPDKYKED